MKGPVKVIYIKDYQKKPSASVIKRGVKAKLAPEYAKKLIVLGVVKVNKHKDEFDKFIQEKKVENAIEAIDNLPRTAKELVSHIKTMTNVNVLEELSADERITVREAAFERLEDIT